MMDNQVKTTGNQSASNQGYDLTNLLHGTVFILMVYMCICHILIVTDDISVLQFWGVPSEYQYLIYVCVCVCVVVLCVCHC